MLSVYSRSCCFRCLRLYTVSRAAALSFREPFAVCLSYAVLIFFPASAKSFVLLCYLRTRINAMISGASSERWVVNQTSLSSLLPCRTARSVRIVTLRREDVYYSAADAVFSAAFYHGYPLVSLQRHAFPYSLRARVFPRLSSESRFLRISLWAAAF